MELIRVENIRKTYHLGEIDVPVLNGVSFTIQRGEMIALMGASGSGKTTLMNILGCLDRPSSGKYILDGQDLSDLSPNQRALVRTAKLGFVFQSFNLLARTTAAQNVVMPLDYSTRRPNHSESRERAHELLVRVGLSQRMDHEPSQMSGGQQQRVAIARSLINEPALLLADEPTGNLDSHTSVEILQMFQALNTQGITVILVTHDPKVASFAHRTIRIADGLIESDGASAPSPGVPHLEFHGGANGNGHSATNGHSNGNHPISSNGDSNGNGHSPTSEIDPVGRTSGVSTHLKVGVAAGGVATLAAKPHVEPIASPIQQAKPAINADPQKAPAASAVIAEPEEAAGEPVPLPHRQSRLLAWIIASDFSHGIGSSSAE